MEFSTRKLYQFHSQLIYAASKSLTEKVKEKNRNYFLLFIEPNVFKKMLQLRVVS